MEQHVPYNMSERDKACIDVNKDFLVALSDAYAIKSKELLHSTILYSQQAIRGMFLLHGACATAIVATKEIATYKSMLEILAVGAFLAVLTAGFSYIAQRCYASHYSDIAANSMLSYHRRVEKLAKPDFIYVSDIAKPEGCKLFIANITSCIACGLWVASSICFGFAIYMFINVSL